jgi:hypothetical protein
MSNPNYPNQYDQQPPQNFYQPNPGDPSMPPRVHGMATTSLVLGIIGLVTSIFIVGSVLGILALIFGILAISQISKNPGRLGGVGLAWAGVITGILSLVLTVLLGFAIMFPSFGRAREISNRSYCSANLTGILKSANVYANDNGDDFPIVLAPRSPTIYYGGGVPSGSTPDRVIDEIYQTGARRGSMSANLWLLVLKGYTGPKQYLCKSDPNFSTVASPSSGGSFYNDFPGVQNISYAAAIPWDNAGNKQGFWKSIVDASLPLMADAPPHNGDSVSGGTVRVEGGVPVKQTMWNSPIHGGEGQVVGWSDAHAGFERRPDIGYQDDNIWTQNGGTPSSTGRAPTYGPPTSSGAYQRSISDYTSGGAPQNWDIYMAPARGADGRAH